jgi:hypothetical protein
MKKPVFLWVWNYQNYSFFYSNFFFQKTRCRAYSILNLDQNQNQRSLKKTIKYMHNIELNLRFTTL